jgi:hypothetical protein
MPFFGWIVAIFLTPFALLFLYYLARGLIEGLSAPGSPRLLQDAEAELAEFRRRPDKLPRLTAHEAEEISAR